MNSGTCSDPAIAGFIVIIKNIMTVFQIIVPIILIASVTFSLVLLVLTPDDHHHPGPHRGPRHLHRAIFYKVGAALIVFFLPYIINLSVAQVPDNTFTVTDCWNAASNSNFFQWNPGGQDISDTGGASAQGE